MKRLKLSFAIGASAMALLAGGAAMRADAQTGDDSNLSPRDIITRARGAYAVLTSYQDEGKTVASLGATSVAPHTFAIKLARPNLYRIAWKQDTGFFVNKGVVWCAGDGDFLKMNDSAKKQKDQESALGGATGVSGGAAASLPGTFFKLNWGDRLGVPMQSSQRKGDEKIAGVDCFVLTRTAAGRTATLWIGKHDFLIRQVENDTTAEALKASLEAEVKKHPELKPLWNQGSKSVETHTRIVVNKPLTAADFAP